MTSAEIFKPRYIRYVTTADVFDTDERGPHIAPVDIITSIRWVHATTNEPVTDPAELERLNRENPITLEEG